MTANRAGNLVQRLIGGRNSDDVLAGLEQSLYGDEDGFFRCGDEHICRRDMLIQFYRFIAQKRVALRFGVAQFQAVPQGAAFGRGHAEQFVHAQALAIGGAEQVLDAEFVAGKEAFELEGLDGHGLGGWDR